MPTLGTGAVDTIVIRPSLSQPLDGLRRKALTACRDASFAGVQEGRPLTGVSVEQMNLMSRACAAAISRLSPSVSCVAGHHPPEVDVHMSLLAFVTATGRDASIANDERVAPGFNHGGDQS
jgi:hypothetical protein